MNMKKLIGIALIIAAFIVEILWLGFCFGSVIVGILLLIFAPGLLFLPFNIIFAFGIAFLANNIKYSSSSFNYNNDFRQDSRFRNEYRDSFSNFRDYSNNDNMQKYYDILGCERDASLETIKAAYKKLSRKFHPDFVEGKGLDDEFVKFANKKMQEINEAYSKIKGSFN
jgi:hypothetical protein